MNYARVLGRAAAFDALGLRKYAQEETSGVSLPQAAAVTAAGLSPFAGMIGRQPIIHDPLQGAKGKDFKSLEGLQRQAREGDVLLTSKDKGSLFKGFIDPVGGSQFYHAQPVTGRAGGKGYTLSAGDLAGENMTPERALRFDHPIAEHLRHDVNNYGDAVLLRPKRPLSPDELARLQESYGTRVQREYDNSKAVGAFLNEMFVPKLDVLARHRTQTVCEGNVCSTLPAMSLHEATGRSVVPGKAAQDVFPTDFLRSTEYELVGSHVTPATRQLQGSAWRKAAPWLMRGGVGAALAGGTYAATEKPELAAGIAGAGAGTMALSHAAQRGWISPDKIPSWENLGGTIMSENGLRSPEARALGARFLTTHVPAMAAGGLAAYGAAKGLQSLYRRATAPATSSPPG